MRPWKRIIYHRRARAPRRRRAAAAPPPRLRLAEYGCDLTAVPLENASAEYFISK